jgi:hypothetical protein
VSRRYAPVPYDALAVAGDDAEYAVFDLYRRAHLAGWGELVITERQLTERWKLGNRRVWSLLEALVEAGFLVIVQRGDKRRPTRIRLLDPAPEDAEATAAQHRDQHRKASATSKTDEQQREQSPNAQHGAKHSGTDQNSIVREEDTRAQTGPDRPDQDDPPREGTHARDGAPPALTPELDGYRELIACQSHGWQEGRPLSPKDQRKIRDALKAGHDVNALLLLAWWAWKAPDREAEFFRSKQLGWSSLLNDRLRVRLDMARAWDAAGRPLTAEATGPPARAAPRRRGNTFADEMAEGIDEKFSQFTKPRVPEDRWLPTKE